MMDDKFLTKFATEQAGNAKNALYVHATEILRQTRGDASKKAEMLLHIQEHKRLLMAY